MTRARWVDPAATDFVADERQPAADRVESDPILESPAPARRGPRPARWFFAALTVLVLALLGFEAVHYVQARFEQHWALGAGFAGLIALVVVSALAWAVLEVRALRRLESVDRARARLQAKAGPEADNGADEDAAVETARLIAEVSAALARRPSLAPALRRYEDEVQDTHEAPQRLALFARDVLSVVDRQAYRAVGRAARDVGVITAVVPTALADTAVVIWRSLRMLREVAELYGYRTGPLGTWFLVRHLLSNAALVAATDVAGAMLAQQLGGALTEAVAARLGGSAVATARTLRMGLLAMQLCRAVPFGADDLPNLRRFAAAVLGQDPARERGEAGPAAPSTRAGGSG